MKGIDPLTAPILSMAWKIIHVVIPVARSERKPSGDMRATMTITLEWWQWVLPAVAACFVVGLYMGWRIMGLWTVGVFFSSLVAARLGPKLDLFINKLLSVAGQFFAIARRQGRVECSHSQDTDSLALGTACHRGAVSWPRCPFVDSS